MGHATRCIPIIRKLKKENKIILGVCSATKPFFQSEFPDLTFEELPAYNIRYSSFLPLWLKLFLQANKIKSIVAQEKKILNALIAKYQIEVVISDSRYGLFSNQTHNIIISHQVFLKTPFLNTYLQKINKSWLQNFDELWIPDFENEKLNLSGALSHGKHFHTKVRYINPQSRLIYLESKLEFDYCIILSGPQPQQNIFLTKLLILCKKHPTKKFALVSPQKINMQIPNVSMVINPDAKTLSQKIASSNKIICRSGFSTLMDLNKMKKNNLILIPTPGQTEQEYLASWWKQNYGAEICLQNCLNELNL
ncbi:MAG: hypothetical protein IPM51_12690 [Sphingobacteriaceae bacterium]|nr:hypothetical protein [Sphingobacteriaceae bacterium]